ncbi:MAG: DUF2924 domain-containing protein [Alsobacter sp.]
MAVSRAADTSLEAEIAHLRGLDLAGLRARWRSVTGRNAPSHVPKHLLFRILAYRVQADALGDLDKATLRYLEELGGGGGSHRGTSERLPLPGEGALRPGTLLMREWQGVQHRVMVLDEGFAWNGTTYRSLSQVARAITGTRWSGPRFFGTGKASVREVAP